jgi:LacI family transcriptional regulator
VPRTTISDVARAAGVSKSTVSRVLSGKTEQMRKETRERVLQAIDELGYRPSSVARSLVSKRTSTLGLVVPDIANPFFSDVTRGAEHEASAKGYSVFLCNTEEDPRREMAVLESLEEKRVDGLVLCSSRLGEDELRAALDHHPAAVLVNRRLEGYDVGVVQVDDEAGGRVATQHLLQAGHRAVGFLAGPPTSYSGRRRVRGYRAALEAAGLPYNPAWVWPCSSGVEGGRGTVSALLTDHPKLTALLCYNDLVAVGALLACAALGRRVPDDLAIVGFDDIPLAALVTPPLTTCHGPRYELGIQAMRLLLGRVNSCIEECEEITLRPKLVVRASAP